MTSNMQRAAERLGVRFAACAHCTRQFVWDPEETFSVMSNPPDGEHDYDDGHNDIVFCCSHACASYKLATLLRGIIWRGGRCGGTQLPSVIL